MRVTILCLLALLVSALQARAQVVPEVVVSWDVMFFAAGVNPDTGQPLRTQNFLKSASQCNLAPVTLPPGPIVNPTRIRVADPDNIGRECEMGPNSDGTLMSLPTSLNQFATSKARGATLVSARSAASNPFDRVLIPAAPLVPTGLKVAP